jgi:ABC-type amino acid transport substrate-binding protein
VFNNKKLVWILAAVLVGCLSIYFLKSSKTSQADLKTIIVGTSADFPPFALVEQDEIVGFDIDLVNEIGKRLQQTIVIKNMPFSTLLPTLQLGHIQVIAAGLTATPERAKHVLFTEPYLDNNPFVIVSLASNPAQTIVDLQNQEVIVNEGYTADLYLSKIDQIHLKRLKTPAEAFLALKSGRAKAFVTAQDTVAPFFAQYSASDFNIAVIPDTSENSSLAVAPQYSSLRHQIQAALDEMQRDGTLATLKAKWKLA